MARSGRASAGTPDNASAVRVDSQADDCFWPAFVAMRERVRRRVRFFGCTRSFGAGAGCGSMAGRRKRRGMVQPTAITSLEDGGRVGGDLKGARGHS